MATRRSTDEPAGTGEEVWVKHPRFSSGTLHLPPFEGKPALKTLEAEVHRQLIQAHQQVQQDLDGLHEQLHAEIHAAVSKELQFVAMHMGEISRSAEASRRELEPLNGAVKQLRDEVQWLRSQREQDITEARATLEGLALEGQSARAAAAAEQQQEFSALKAVLAEAHAKLQGELQTELGELQEQLGEAQQQLWERQQQQRETQKQHGEAQEQLGETQEQLGEAQEQLQAQLEEMQEQLEETKAQIGEAQKQLSEDLCVRKEAQAEQHVQQEAKAETQQGLEELSNTLNQRLAEAEAEAQRGLQQLSNTLSQRLAQLAEDAAAERARLAARLEKQRSIAEQQQAEMQSSIATLESALRSEVDVGQARFADSQAASAELEQRLKEALLQAIAEQSDGARCRADELGTDVQEQLSNLAGELEQRLGTVESQLQQHTEGLRNAHAGLARSVEWSAEVDRAQLESEGKYEASSPYFALAGLVELQLRLFVQRQGAHKWACGAFLRAAAGQVAFRLHVGGRSQNFSAEFGETPEWGSPRIVVLERAEPTLSVRLEVTDVAAPAPGWPRALSATLQVTDATLAAAREGAALRAAFVRRVEWRVARVSERLAAARTGGPDLEPLCSPPFAAAGAEGLQLQLYPLGYRSRGDDMCGFFLVCPRGLSVKCRAFVGDACRTFEYRYEAREPYGRGSFCRLADKVSEDDSVVCGVEFMEARQEHTKEVRGGPYGAVADQLKIVSSPANGGMEAVRELREAAPPPGRPKACRQRPSERAPNHVPGMGNSKSLPVLLPVVAGPGRGRGDLM